MPRQEQVLSVFVASPSDVQDERDKLDEVIGELNKTWSRDLRVRLELVRWETNAYPAKGIDPQDVINHQIPNDYDIFIAIMWCRYGTKTGRADSGTVEEFLRAKSRHDRDPNSVQLMVYFKDAPISPSQVDPEHLAKVRDFRSSLSDDGTLYWQFKNTADFEQHIRLHLSRIVQAWKNDKRNHAETNSTIVESRVAEETIDDEGFLDYLDVFEDKSVELRETLRRISDATEEVGLRMDERNEEINIYARNTEGRTERRESKRLIAKAASDITQYTARIEAELPLFRAAMSVGMSAFSKAISVSGEFATANEDLRSASDLALTVAELRTGLGSSKNAIYRLRSSIAGLPRMTSDLNKAKRGATRALDDLLAEFNTADALVAESEKAIQDMLKSAKKSDLSA